MADELPYSVGIWTVKSGKEDAFLKTWRELVDGAMKSNKGSINFVMLHDIEQKNAYMSVGKWGEMKKFQEWRQTPEFKTIFAKLEELCDDIKIKSMVSVVNIP